MNYPTTPGGQAIRSEYTYDNINRLETLVNKVGSNIISQYSYGYDNNGNITSVTENGITTQYTYDDLNRLAGITRPNEEISYSYDTRGNRTELIVNTTIPYNAVSGIFGYNNWDELAQFTTDGNTYQYKYDAEGLRTKKESTGETVRYHLDNNGRVVAESNSSDQVTAQNIWGHKALARKVSGTYYYYIYNGHGDVVQVLDVNGNVVNSYTYDEWGNTLSQTEQISNPIRYAGEYYDEKSGLYYLRARYYDPSVGRFISEDSNEGQLTNPLSLNLYTYCLNDPIKYYDSTGNFAQLAVRVLESPTGQQLMAKGGALVAEFGEFVTMYGAQLENKAIAAIDKGSNWLKNKLGGSSGQDPNKFKKVPEDKVVNALSNFQGKNFQFGNQRFLLDKSGLKHILTRHHPNYWDGS